MEKLQPILKHKFWIISGIALLIPLIGWFMDRGAIAERIQTRWDTLSKLAPPSGANTPNQTYIDGIKFVNERQAERQKVLERELYEEQKQLWFWPAEVADRMAEKSYRDRVNNSILQDYRFAYTDHFVKDVVESTIRPYRVSYSGEESGLVKVDGGTGNFGGGMAGGGMPGGREFAGGGGTGLGMGENWFPSSIQHIDAKSRWATEPPTPKEMWDAQEDLWLIQSLLEAVAEVNDGARRVSDAPIREIHTLFLRGGSRPDPNAAAAGGMDGGMGMAGMAEPGGYAGGGGGGGAMFGNRMGGGEGGMMGLGGQQSADFADDLDSVFGSAQPVAAGGMGGDPMGGSPGGGYAGGGNMMPGGMMGGGMMGGDGVGGNQNLRRYVDDDPELPYKTRGFYLHVTMLHSDLPRLQAALVSRGWPVTLLRVQFVSKHHDFEGMNLDGQGGRRRMGREGGGLPLRRRPRGLSPMGGGLAEGPMGFGGGAGGGAGPGSVVLSPNADEQQTLWDAAMEDPYLADVAIAGLMTLYSSPDIDEEAIQEAEAEDVAKQQATQQNATPDQTQLPAGEGETPMPTDGAPMPLGQEQPANGGNPANPNPNPANPMPATNGTQPGTPAAVTPGNGPQPNPMGKPDQPTGNTEPATPGTNTPAATGPTTENPPPSGPPVNP
ncbi:hypothetical protein [Thalassoroseus pseudoceratinae]|uniref:hypothetical protein n=1 Tax=Thalassoroseus pseudoceratinae TaxID=2713176 RepID=UPI00141DA66B|nr:hypothetical protein [Thalassoroseus pseudoceratinae]